MSRKDFVAIAAAIKSAFSTTHDITDGDRKNSAQIAMREVACQISNACADSNPRFDRARFLSACGIE